MDLIVLPCIGSHDQTTFKPSFFIALINLGKNLSTLSCPNLEINVIFPFSFFGFIALQILTISSGLDVGPHFIPIGFSIPLQNST